MPSPLADNAALIAFVPVADLARATDFYASALGLRLLESVPRVVSVFEIGRVRLRVTQVPDHTPASSTTVGWAVSDIGTTVRALMNEGVEFTHIEGMTGADLTWTAPGGDRIAWFRDPDGNTLSLTQFTSRAPTRLNDITPVFPVRSVRAALDRYRKLGFAANAFGDDDSSENDPIYGFIERNGVSLHVTRVDDLDPLKSMSAAYLYVDDADALHREWTAAGVLGHHHAPSDTPYGLREGAFVDPDGNLIRYGSPLR